MGDGMNFRMIKKDNHLNSKLEKDSTQVDYLAKVIILVLGDSAAIFTNKDDCHIYHFFTFNKNKLKMINI